MPGTPRLCWKADDLRGEAAARRTAGSFSAFMSGPGTNCSGFNKNFPLGGLAISTVPNLTSADGAFAATAPTPPAQESRVTLNSPDYNDVEAIFTKLSGCPRRPFLARTQRTKFAQTPSTSSAAQPDLRRRGHHQLRHRQQNHSASFSQTQGALGSLTVELQARFSF